VEGTREKQNTTDEQKKFIKRKICVRKPDKKSPKKDVEGGRGLYERKSA